MKNRRTRLIDSIEMGPPLRATAAAYLIASTICLAAATFIFFLQDSFVRAGSSSLFLLLTAACCALLWLLTLGGAVLVVMLLRRCHICRSGPGRRISTAMEKMSKGDLGWKITLRRSDELADVADSVSRASQLLADRIAKLQAQTRELSEVGDYLDDSLESNRAANPNMLKALRKLKICTNRLQSDIDDFHVSAMSIPMNDDARQDIPIAE